MVPKTVRRGLVAFMQSMRLFNPDTLDLRKDGSFTHLHLRFIDGFECKVCGFCSQSCDPLCRHVSKEHGSNQTPNSEWVVGDYIQNSPRLQSWTKVGKRGLWTVCTSQITSPDADRINSYPLEEPQQVWTPNHDQGTLQYADTDDSNLCDNLGEDQG